MKYILLLVTVIAGLLLLFFFLKIFLKTWKSFKIWFEDLKKSMHLFFKKNILKGISLILLIFLFLFPNHCRRVGHLLIDPIIAVIEELSPPPE